jgi:hypothetical protein
VYQLDSDNQAETKIINKQIEEFNNNADTYNNNQIKRMLQKNADKLNKHIDQQMSIANANHIGAKLKAEINIWKHLTEIDASKLDFFKSYKEAFIKDINLNDLNKGSQIFKKGQN